MALVSINFLEAGEATTDSLAKYLTTHDVQIDRNDDTLKVDASTVQECERLGQLLADFVRTMEGNYPLSMAGPGGKTRLSQLRTSEDARMISGLLTACADLL